MVGGGKAGGPGVCTGSLQGGLQTCGQVEGLGSFSGILPGASKWLVLTLNFFKEGYEMFVPAVVLN